MVVGSSIGEAFMGSMQEVEDKNIVIIA